MQIGLVSCCLPTRTNLVPSDESFDRTCPKAVFSTDTNEIDFPLTTVLLEGADVDMEQTADLAGRKQTARKFKGDRFLRHDGLRYELAVVRTKLTEAFKVLSA